MAAIMGRTGACSCAIAAVATVDRAAPGHVRLLSGFSPLGWAAPVLGGPYLMQPRLVDGPYCFSFPLVNLLDGAGLGLPVQLAPTGVAMLAGGVVYIRSTRGFTQPQRGNGATFTHLRRIYPGSDDPTPRAQDYR